MMARSTRCHKVAKQNRRKRAPRELASMQPRSDTDKADAEVEAIAKSADYSLARSKHMHKQSMPDGILAGQTAGQPADTKTEVNMKGATHPNWMAAPPAQQKLEFDFPKIRIFQSKILHVTLQLPRLILKLVHSGIRCYTLRIISAEIALETDKDKQKLGRAKEKNSKPQAVTKENLCASSKRKLEAYRARNLKPQEGVLANTNNEMFETILQSKLPETLIDGTHASQVTWINITLKKDYICLSPMDGYRDMPIRRNGAH